MLYNTLKNNAFFLLPYLIVSADPHPQSLLIFSKPDIHLWINQFHSPFFDWIFKYLTFLGDGLFIIIPALVLLFFSLRHFAFLDSCLFLNRTVHPNT